MRLINSKKFGYMNGSKDRKIFGEIENVLKNGQIIHWLGS